MTRQRSRIVTPSGVSVYWADLFLAQLLYFCCMNMYKMASCNQDSVIFSFGVLCIRQYVIRFLFPTILTLDHRFEEELVYRHPSSAIRK